MSRSSQRSTIKDMTNGSPTKLILGFAVPMLMGLLFFVLDQLKLTNDRETE